MGAAERKPIDITARESVGQRVSRLMAEAREAGSQQVSELETALANVARLAAEIADGGDAYPVGVRDLSRRLVDDVNWCGQTIAQIMTVRR